LYSRQVDGQADPPVFIDYQGDVSDCTQSDADSHFKDICDDESVDSAIVKEEDWSDDTDSTSKPDDFENGVPSENSPDDSREEDYELVAGDADLSDIRKLPLTVPSEITEEWLSSLPLLTMSEDDEELILTLLQLLTDRVEQEEPIQEFMVRMDTYL